MADLDLQTVLNSGDLTSAFFGGTTSADKVALQSDVDIVNTTVTTNTTNIATNTADIATNVTDIAALDTRLTAEEAKLSSAISIITATPLTAQTLVADTPEKLEWMTSAVVDSGGTDISYDIPTDNITILTAGVYKVYGIVTLNIPINDIVEIELYVDNLPTGFKTVSIGRGDTSPVTFNYSFMNSFSVNDEITLYIQSTGTTATVQTASVTVEKTGY